MKRILYITNLPSPYKVDFFNELSNSYEITVVCERQSAKDRDKRWIAKEHHNFKLTILNGFSVGNEGSLSLEIFKYVLMPFDAVIVNGYSSLTMLIAISFLNLLKRPYIIACDGMVMRDKSIKETIKSIILKKAALCLSSWKMNTDALLHCRVSTDKIREYPFSSMSEKDMLLDVPNRTKAKSDIGCRSKKMILYVGQMIHRKGVDLLVEAFSELKLENTELICVGGDSLLQYKYRYCH